MCWGNGGRGANDDRSWNAFKIPCREMTLAIFRLGSHHASLVSMIMATSYRQHIQTFIYSSSRDILPNMWTLLRGCLIVKTVHSYQSVVSTIFFTNLFIERFKLVLTRLLGLITQIKVHIHKQFVGYSVCRNRNGCHSNKSLMLRTNYLRIGWFTKFHLLQSKW